MHGLTRSLAALILAAIGGAAGAAAQADLEPGGQLREECRLARDPRRCAARLEARAACRDKRGTEKRRCLAVLLPPPDCQHASDAARCKALAAARAACQGKAGGELRRCMQTQLPGWRGYQAG